MPASESSYPTAQALAGNGGDGGSFTGVDLQALLGTLTQTRAGPREPAVVWDACHPVWFTGSVGATALDQPNSYGPNDPYYWDLRTLSVWGFTAGYVTAYLNNTSGEIIAQTPTAAAAAGPGQFTWSGQIILTPRDRLVFTGTSITGNVYVTGRAIEVAGPWLPEYLM